MSHVMQRLRQDHHNARELLDLLDAETQGLAAAESADLDLINSVLQYFEEYPGRYHHPLEDEMYHRLLARDARGASGVGDLVAEHAVLADARLRLAVLVEQVKAEQPVSRHAVGVLAREYIDLYRRHMDREDAEFFPAAEGVLDPEDWVEIEAVAAQPPDPLFNGGDAPVYRELHARLVRPDRGA